MYAISMAEQQYTPQILSYNLLRPVTPQLHKRRIFSLKSTLDFNLSPKTSHSDTREASDILLSTLEAYEEALTEPVTTSGASFDSGSF